MKRIGIILALVLAFAGLNGMFVVDALGAEQPITKLDVQFADDNGGGGVGCYAGVYWRYSYNTGQLVADHSNPGWIKYYWVIKYWGCENGTRWESYGYQPAW